MAFVPQFASGFEAGAVPGGISNSGCTIVSGGTYGRALRVGATAADTATITVTGSPSEVYIGLFWHPRTYWAAFAGFWNIDFILNDGMICNIVWQQTYWQMLINGVSKGTGATLTNTYYNLQLYLKVSDAGGEFTLKVNGNSDISFSGDTKPSTGTYVTSVRFRDTGGSTYHCDVDNVVVGTGGWPGVIYCSTLVPSADGASQNWTRSSGSDGWALIEEIPATDSDYVSTDTNEDDTYELGDFDSSQRVPLFAVVNVRASRLGSDSQRLTALATDGSNTLTGTAYLPGLTFGQHEDLFTTAPDGGAWSDSDLDALKVGVRRTTV
jgi:hypothetical protein